MQSLQSVRPAAVGNDAAAEEWRHRLGVSGSEGVTEGARAWLCGDDLKGGMATLQSRGKELSTDELKMIVDRQGHGLMMEMFC